MWYRVVNMAMLFFQVISWVVLTRAVRTCNQCKDLPTISTVYLFYMIIVHVFCAIMSNKLFRVRVRVRVQIKSTLNIILYHMRSWWIMADDNWSAKMYSIQFQAKETSNQSNCVISTLSNGDLTLTKRSFSAPIHQTPSLAPSLSPSLCTSLPPRLFTYSLTY